MAIANSCWDLQKASEGRFILGLGPLIKAHDQSRFSVQWSAPVPRMWEYVAALHGIVFLLHLASGTVKLSIPQLFDRSTLHTV